MPKHQIFNQAIVLIACLVAFQSNATGQEVTPFVEADPQITQLNELAGRGDAQLAMAIGSFTRIKDWTDADRWLKTVTAINDQRRLAAIASQIGAENLFRLRASDEISPAGKAAVNKLSDAFKADSESVDKLVAAIDALDDDSADRQLEAARTVLRGGRVAVGELVKAAVVEKPVAPRTRLLQTMMRLGGNGPQALSQLALYGNESVRLGALDSITRIDRTTALASLITAIHASDSTPAERQFARDNIRPLRSVPSREEAIQFLFSDLQRLRRVANERENNLDVETVWTVGNDRKSVSSQTTRSMILAYRDAYDAGSRLRRVGGLLPLMTDTVLAADLSYRIVIDSDWGRPDQIAAMQAAYKDTLSPVALLRSIEIAIQRDDTTALVGLLRLVDAAPGAQTMILSTSAKPTPLVLSAMHSQPRVRYEAAAAILRIGQPPSYAGRSYVMRCIAEMSRLGDRPLAILVETRSDVIVRQETILSRLGYQTQVVGSVLGLERCIQRGGDLRLVLSKTQLADHPPVELIDRVRRAPLGKSVPIIFFGGLLDEEDMRIALTALKEKESRIGAEVDLQLSALKTDTEVDDTFAILLEELAQVGATGDWQDAQAALDVLLASRSRLLDATSAPSETAWDKALDLAKSRIKFLRQQSNEVEPFVEPDLDADRLGINSSRWAGISQLIGRPQTPSAFSGLLMDLELTSRLPALSPIDRSQFRRLATEFLTQNTP